MLKFSSFWLLFILFITVIFFAGCKAEEEEEDPTPEEAFQAFAAYWEEGKYEQMYEMISPEVKQEISKEDFVEKHIKTYEEIAAENHTIKMMIEEEREEEPQEEKEPLTDVTIEFEQSMDTVVGPFVMDSKIKLELLIGETEEEVTKTWVLNWRPDIILPYLDFGDEVRVTITEPAQRGEIIDRNGEGLAINGEVYQIGIVPERLPEDAPEAILKEAADLLNITLSHIERELNQAWVQPDLFVPLTSVSRDNEALVEELMNIEGRAVTYRLLPGRVYPLGKAAAHLVGYIGPINADELEERSEEGYHRNSLIGKTGLERIYEDKLRGELGAKIFIVNEAGNEKLTLDEKDAVNGATIQLTIDKDLQETIYKQLEGEAGTAVALHPLTGEVLSLVNAPVYNPNDFVLGISSEKWNELLENEEKPLTNRFTQRYAPGSTIKPVTAKIAIENGWDREERRKIEGDRWQRDSSWGGYHVRRVTDPGHDVNLHDALVYSDNIYFAQMALELGAEKVEEGFENFGFGESLPFIYEMSASRVANDAINSDLLLADTGYGQGQMLMSPLHLALLYTPFVNDGAIMKPKLLAGDAEPEIWKDNVIDTESSNYILSALIDVIESPVGTGRDAQIDALRLAGKTGTTEHKSSQDEDGEETGWFVAMNTDDPELLVLMMIENVEGRGGSGFVVPKVRNVFLEAFSR